MKKQDSSWSAAHPSLGSKEWFAKIHGGSEDLVFGHQLVKEHRPLEVYETDERGQGPEWCVQFVGTVFWADVFHTQAEAESYAEAWNSQRNSK